MHLGTHKSQLLGSCDYSTDYILLWYDMIWDMIWYDMIYGINFLSTGLQQNQNKTKLTTLWSSQS